MRDLARFYLGFGLNITPLGADKRPVVTGVATSGAPLHFKWQEWQTTLQAGRLLAELFRPAWWADVQGIAGICGPISKHALCIDFDHTDFALVEQFLGALDMPTPYPWTVRSPGGGWHVWLRCALDLPKGKLDAPATSGGHVELRYTGHYVALPGSLHPSGSLYTWHHDAPTEPPTVVLASTLLAAYRAVTLPPEPTPPLSPLTPSTSSGGGNGNRSNGNYATIALTNEVNTVIASQAGYRNDTLNTAAFNLGQLVGEQALDETEVDRALMGAALTVGLTESEAHATIASGLAAGKLSPRSPSANGNGAGLTAYANGFAGDTPDPLDTPDEHGHKAWPYAVKFGRMCYCWEKDGEIERKPIADFSAAVAEEIHDEDGGKTFVVAGKALRSGAFSVDVPAEVFGDERKLKGLLDAAVGAKDPIYKGMTPHLSAAIKLLTPSDLPTVRRFQRTGWSGNQFLLPGRTNVSATQRIDLPRKLPYHAAADNAEIEDALNALKALLDSIPATLSAPIVTMLLQAPLHRKANWHNERYGFFIQGRTGSLKTSFAQTAMCIYGAGFADESLLLKWGEGATRNAIMSLAAHAHDLPLLIDNYKPNTGGGKDDFINLIHNILEGGEKDRLTRASTLRESKPVHCFPLITGEDIPHDDAASLARLLAVSFEWQRGQPNDLLASAQRLAHHLPLVGSLWIDWVEAHEPFTLDTEMHARRAHWAALLVKQRADMANPLRVATNLATNELTWRILLDHPILGAVFAPYSQAHGDGLTQIAVSMATQTAEASEAQQFMAALRELLITGQYKLQPRGVEPSDLDKDRMLGWHDGAGVYLLPAISLAAVKRLLGPHALPGSVQSLYNQMAELKWIATKGNNNETTKILSVASQKQRVLHLHWSALRPADDDEDQSLLMALGL